jgi:ABC-2 type transport system ATP-binding protein
MTKQAVIKLSGVTKTFGRHIALQEISLEVRRGIVFALLGENGAGKTTMIRTLLGVIDADRGTSEVLGLTSFSHGQEIRRRCGYVSERPTLYEWMTVEEAGWFGAGFYPEGYLDRYRKFVGDFGLQLKDKIKTLSKGMRAKVALALAMSHEPELLVLDEPTSGLDTLVRREFLESMVDLTADGRTVFLSSHQISEVERVADVVAILREGRLVLVQPLDQLKRTTAEFTLTLSDHETPLEVPGAVIHQRRRGRQCSLMMGGEPHVNYEAVRALPLVETVEQHQPSLEDIFVAYMCSSPAMHEQGLDQALEDSEERVR